MGIAHVYLNKTAKRPMYLAIFLRAQKIAKPRNTNKSKKRQRAVHNET